MPHVQKTPFFFTVSLVLNQRFHEIMNVILYAILGMVPMQSDILCSGFLCANAKSMSEMNVFKLPAINKTAVGLGKINAHMNIADKEKRIDMSKKIGKKEKKRVGRLGNIYIYKHIAVNIAGRQNNMIDTQKNHIAVGKEMTKEQRTKKQ
jgi:hypothetical protein